jgi:hypothetical protein
MGVTAVVAATVGSIYSTRKAGKAAQSQARAEQRRAEIQNVRSTRQAIREARLAQGSIVSQGALGGTMGSSGVAGGLSSVSAQLGGNLNYIASIAEENTNIFNAQIAGAKAATNASIFGQVGSLAGSFKGMGTTPGVEPTSRYTSGNLGSGD